MKPVIYTQFKIAMDVFCYNIQGTIFYFGEKVSHLEGKNVTRQIGFNWWE